MLVSRNSTLGYFTDINLADKVHHCIPLIEQEMVKHVPSHHLHVSKYLLTFDA